MAARDDSVIRGSLITCLILLVLSLALNFIFWRWGNTQSSERDSINQQLTDARNAIRDLEGTKLTLYKMVSDEAMTEGEYEALASSSTGDAQFDTIATKFYGDMKAFGQEVPIQERHYGKLTDYFTDTVRDRNERYRQVREELATVRTQAEADVATARAAQQKAETERENLAKQLDDERAQFAKSREDMTTKMELARDSKTKSERALQQMRRTRMQEEQQLNGKITQLENTIETQKLELNKLRDGRFESVQGEITWTMRGGRDGTKIVSINLGSADQLRPGITFGVVDRDDTSRLQDADVKASIQVTKILGPHSAEARVVAVPKVGNPIIPGDAVYSPFWAPGRTVRIALAGNIDIDGDDKPDNPILEGMIRAAGAEVADNGEQSGRIDPGIRFLVVGDTPDLGDTNQGRAAAEIARVGAAKQRAIEAGVTVIPAWKLEAYLRTLDDSLTTPLGSAVRGEDFPARRIGGPARRRPVDLPEIFKNQKERVQDTNEIVKP